MKTYSQQKKCYSYPTPHTPDSISAVSRDNFRAWPCMFELPAELLARIAEQAGAPSLLALAATCHQALRWEAEHTEHLWKRQLRDEFHAQVIRKLFDGCAPSPPPGMSARRWYFEFASSWPSLAQQRSGRVLLRLDSRCKLPDLPIWSFMCLGFVPRGLQTFDVYDVTAFAPHHPGGEALILNAATAVEDASRLFGMGRHSHSARQMLSTMAIDGLTHIPYTPGAHPRSKGRGESWRALLPSRYSKRLLARDLLGLLLLSLLNELCHPAFTFAATLSFPWWSIIGSAMLPRCGTSSALCRLLCWEDTLKRTGQ